MKLKCRFDLSRRRHAFGARRPINYSACFKLFVTRFDVERSSGNHGGVRTRHRQRRNSRGLLGCGVNRVSLGVQSFVDKECSSVGRLHTRGITLADIARLRSAGIGNISIDLIAGLPHQTDESWDFSLSETLATGVPHVSVYMLEVDDDSRLGNELLAGGSRYHAHFVPDDDLIADLYLAACERLEKGGVAAIRDFQFRATGNARHRFAELTP